MDAPTVLTREQVRRVDRIAIDEFGIPGVVLMENAGRGCVDALLERDPRLVPNASEAGHFVEGAASRVAPSPLPNPPRRGEGTGRFVVVLCGKGNNAGDGFVIARHLALRRIAARIVRLRPASELTGDALINYQILERCGADIVDASAAGSGGAALHALLDEHAIDADWLVDALLGTGAVGAPREPFRSAISWMNAQTARRLAVDVPSGLDCDTGIAAGEAVRADLTCTFVAAKPGLLAACAAEYVGELRVVSIGAPQAVIDWAARS